MGRGLKGFLYTDGEDVSDFFLFCLICFIEFLRGKGKGKGIFGLYVAKSPLGVLLFF